MVGVDPQSGTRVAASCSTNEAGILHSFERMFYYWTMRVRVVEEVGHWWNGGHGDCRKDVWFERLSNGLVQVRWRGKWKHRDGAWRTSSGHEALEAVDELLGDGSTWRETSRNGGEAQKPR